MQKRNQAIIDAIIAKAEQEYPGALAMIGIYGSFLTGDIHEKSDLDLMILVNDERGYNLARCFIQADAAVGHDLYCTTWEALEADAEYSHPHISKLMDSKIVYCSDPAHPLRLDALRRKAKSRMDAPLSLESLEKARPYLALAEQAFARTVLAQSLTEVRMQGAFMLYNLQSATAMVNQTYFRKSTRRVWDEIRAMAHKPGDFEKLALRFIHAQTVSETKEAACNMIAGFQHLFRELENTFPGPKAPASPDNLRGTYEEMFSNWRNKLHLAAKTGDAHLAFSSLASMQNMLSEIESVVQIRHYDVMACFHPENLPHTAQECDAVLDAYLAEYRDAGICPLIYPNIDGFIADYR